MLRSEIPRDVEWDVIVDLFMYRDPEKAKVEEKQEVEDAGEGDEGEPEVVATG